MIKQKYDDVVTLYLLTNCDMECKFCYASKNIGKMTYNQAINTIDYFKSIGAKKLSLTGGEIMLHPDVEAITKYAYNLGFEINFFTSGSLLTIEKFQSISRYIKWLTLSLDGDRTINKEMGRIEKHYDRVLELLSNRKKCCSRSGH